jgi:alpha,alpha-trehalose phosphorylase
MRDWDGQVSFAPRLPRGIERLVFQVGLRGRRLRVEVTPDTATYALRKDDTELEISHWGEQIELSPGTSVARPISPAPRLPEPEQPRGRAPQRRRPEDRGRPGTPT